MSGLQYKVTGDIGEAWRSASLGGWFGEVSRVSTNQFLSPYEKYEMYELLAFPSYQCGGTSAGEMRAGKGAEGKITILGPEGK